MYYTYILKSESDRTFYTGYTSNLERRLIEHNSGKSGYTSHHTPWKLIYYEAFINQKDALSRENYFKTFDGRQERKHILRNYIRHNDETSGEVIGSRAWKLKHKLIDIGWLVFILFLILYILPEYGSSFASFLGNLLFK